jgi:DNA-binding transcriptional LysR family regulator
VWGKAANLETTVSKKKSTENMREPDWDDMRVLREVVRAGSLRKASDSLNLKVSTISKRIDSLEGRLGKKLFQRTAHGLVLTMSGRHVATGADSMGLAMDETKTRLSTSRDVDGEVRLLMSEGPADRWFVPHFLNTFIRRHPRVALRLGTTSETSDSAVPSFDIHIQYGPVRDPGYVGVRIASFHFLFFASKEYIANFGKPLSVSDLADHRFADAVASVATAKGFMSTYSNMDVYGRASIVSNSGLVIANAVAAGAVIGLLPSYIYLTSSHYVPVLPEIHHETGIFLKFCSENADRPEVRSLIDFLKETVFDKRLPWFSDRYQTPKESWRAIFADRVLSKK